MRAIAANEPVGPAVPIVAVSAADAPASDAPVEPAPHLPAPDAEAVVVPTARTGRRPAHARPSKRPARRLRLKIALATAGVLMLVVVGIGAASLLAPGGDGEGLVAASGDGASGEGAAARDTQAPADSASGGPGSSGKAGAPATEDRSGTVVYRYMAPSADGEGRSVVETVRFGRDGLCEKTTMEATFADESEAAAFIDALRRDYGSAFEDGAAEGASATATLDVSANKLDREAYEDTLRESVQDLSLVKKS